MGIQNTDFGILQDFFMSLADIVSKPIILVDDEGHLRFASAEAVNLLSMATKSLPEVRLDDLVREIDLEFLLVKDSGEDRRLRYQSLPVKWGSASARLLILTPDENESGMTFASNEDFNTLMSSMHDAVAVGTMKQDGGFYLVYLSQPIKRITGFPVENFMRDANFWFNLVYMEDRAKVLEFWDEMYSMENGSAHVAEYRIVKSDGTVCWVEDNQVCRRLSEEERRFYSFLTDISQKKKAEQERDLSEDRYKLLAETISDVITLQDTEGNFLYVSPSLEKLLGYRPEEAIGKNWFSWMHSEDRKKHSERLQANLREGKEFSFEWRGRLKSGQFIWLETRCHAIFKGDRKVRGWVSSMREIDSHKRIEEALIDTNRRLQESISELETRNTEANLINQIGEKFLACNTQEEVYLIVQENLPKLIKGGRGALYIVANGNKLYERRAVWGELYGDSQVLTPEFCWSLSRGQVFRLRDSRSIIVCRNLEEISDGKRVCPCLCVPMIFQRETLGVLSFKEWKEPSFERVEQLAVTMAEKIGMSLVNIRLRETLRMQSLRDSLTGLFNRRYLDETLERELHRSLRTSQTICIVMIDIDHFKKYNDLYGHDAGDALLQLFGKYLQEHIRGSDIACRYGGEEFVVVMPDTGIEDAIKRAEQLRIGLKSLSVVYQGKELEGITVSVGISIFPEHGLTSRSMIKAADVALYAAKNQGRDCVAVAASKK
jgi:diguanylate cyclase (GGDEF)-like protein/PAS domain S-box-containing protein